MCENLWLAGVIAITMFAGGCQPASPVSTTPTATPESATMPEVTAKDPKQIAAAAKEEMFKTLSAKLLEAMSQGGPASAIEVCSKDAPKIADRIGKQFDVQIGRTSFKLRNSKNTPPDWVKPIIENKPTETRFVDLPENHTGALFPITLKVQCLACHGPKAQISSDVQAQLDRIYPEDQATGFNEGDLRGWFWVDVPFRNLEMTSESPSK